MIHVPTYYSWQVTCRSAEQCEALRQSVSPAIDLDRVITDTAMACEGGVPRTWQEHHRLGDYFADLQFVPTSPESFLFVLRRRPEAGRFWKDLMVGILRQLEDDPVKPKITIHEKSDTPPVELAAAKS